MFPLTLYPHVCRSLLLGSIFAQWSIIFLWDYMHHLKKSHPSRDSKAGSVASFHCNPAHMHPAATLCQRLGPYRSIRGSFCPRNLTIFSKLLVSQCWMFLLKWRSSLTPAVNGSDSLLVSCSTCVPGKMRGPVDPGLEVKTPKHQTVASGPRRWAIKRRWLHCKWPGFPVCGNKEGLELPVLPLWLPRMRMSI